MSSAIAALVLSALCVFGLSTPESALERFVAAPDDAYEYTIQSLQERTHLGVTYTQYELRMYSQRWRSPEEVNHTRWTHKMIVAIPHEPITDMAALTIEGGFTNMWIPPVDLREQMARTRAPIATVMYVPNQPLVFSDESSGRSEDDLLAYSFDRYLRTGDEEWPALFPMVKAAVRAMDTVVDLAAREHAVTVNRFCLIGASKRGWTAWLTAAIDPRVHAVVPLVIDVLNMEAQISHHFESYGFYTGALGPYASMGIFDRFWLPRGQALRTMVDPFAYRDRLTMPKYIVNSPGDAFFPADASQLYRHALAGEMHLRYVPNTDHGLAPDGTVLTGITNFFISVSRGTQRPEITWARGEDGSLQIEVVRGFVNGVKLWQADNPSARSFLFSGGTGIRFADTDLTEDTPGSGVYTVDVQPPATGFRAFFVEVRFPGAPMLTTDVYIMPETLPFRPNMRITGTWGGGTYPLESVVPLSVSVEDAQQTVAYQWYKDGDPIPGAIAPTLTLGPLAPGDEGVYGCRVREGLLRPVFSSAMAVALGDLEEPHPIPGDINGDGIVNAVDVQLVINAALGIPLAPGHDADIDGDGKINAVDVQLVINAALGLSIR